MINLHQNDGEKMYISENRHGHVFSVHNETRELKTGQEKPLLQRFKKEEGEKGWDKP